MNSERWRRVEALFNHAVEMNDGQREAYIKDASNGDSELLRELQDRRLGDVGLLQLAADRSYDE